MRKRNKRRLSAELNIINLVDVVFALLIIFMITAPMMTQGVQVDLPKADAENIEINDYISVTINGRNEIFIDQERVSLLDFPQRFRMVFKGKVSTPVFINADKRVPYGIVVRIITDVQKAGAVKLGFLTLPLADKSSP